MPTLGLDISKEGLTGLTDLLSLGLAGDYLAAGWLQWALGLASCISCEWPSPLWRLP